MKCKVCLKLIKKERRLTCSQKCFHASRSMRMIFNNPMGKKVAKEKMIRTFKRLKLKPKIQGGNGRDVPLSQRKLFKALGKGWKLEYPVATYLRSINPEYPTCYKIDIAHPRKKIAIEVDGRSHNLLRTKEKDKKKDEFLRSVGWLVFRYKNRDVLENLKSICTNISRI